MEVDRQLLAAGWVSLWIAFGRDRSGLGAPAREKIEGGLSGSQWPGVVTTAHAAHLSGFNYHANARKIAHSDTHGRDHASHFAGP